MQFSEGTIPLMDRREFMKDLSLAAAGTLATGMIQSCASTAPKGADQSHARIMKQDAKANCSVSRNADPAAIAMWDFSWLLRHQPCGEFEDWDGVLDGLVSRGYNAIRIDAFPNLVAANPQGRVIEEHSFPKGDWKPTMWGNNYSITVNPRQALKEFIPRCIDRGILIGLSTWFSGPGCEKIEGLDGLVRVWDETLTFLKDNDLLHNIYYVDLLNEYPMYNGFSWLRNQMDAMKKDASGKQAEAIADPAERARKAHEWNAHAGNYNDPVSRKFYIDFANGALDRLKAKWPELDFMTCVTNTDSADWKAMDFSHCAAMDVHYWFIINNKSFPCPLYWANIHELSANDQIFPKVQESLTKAWVEHKDDLVAWMDAEMGAVAAKGRQFNKPIGNTEGWGTINWLDHPALTWDVIKEAGEICARLGRKHGYRFNCTSNFTHPQFPRLWQDVAWHRRVTDIIRNG